MVLEVSARSRALGQEGVLFAWETDKSSVRGMEGTVWRMAGMGFKYSLRISTNEIVKSFHGQLGWWLIVWGNMSPTSIF